MSRITSRTLRRVARTHALVLLYHAVFESIPAELAKGLHNVRPRVLRDQLAYLGDYFTFVDVDALASMDDPAGHAALTFDDGYRSVFENALPILEDLGVPCTVFLNGSSLEGGVFWRDKIRLVESMGWVKDFEASMTGMRGIEGSRFYRYTKSPENDSRVVDAELDRFLERRNAARLLKRHRVSDLDRLPVHPLLRYGNHGHRHYVMSSLDPDAQYEEVAATRRLLERMRRHRVSELFSIPFGDARDFDAHTVAALRRNGYTKALLSRNRLQSREASRIHGMDVVERFMPRTEARHAGLDAVDATGAPGPVSGS